MGNLSSKPLVVQLDARLTTATIEKYYNTLARRRAAGEQANSSDLQGHDYRPRQDTKNEGINYDSKSGDEDYRSDTKKVSGVHLFNETTKSDKTAITPMRVGSQVLRNASARPSDRAMAKLYGDSSLQIFKANNKRKIDRALTSLTKSGFDIKCLGEAAVAWIKAHPWEPAAIVVPLFILAWTPVILSGVGFEANGVAAGKRT